MAEIELRAFASLQQLFKQQGWNIPCNVTIPEEGTTGRQLAKQLNIPESSLEAVFINGVAYGLDQHIKPGDRVGLVPPGLPSIYRVHLGFYSKDSRKRS
ncbi:MAG: MoaD/ThiS family protein [Desulfotomaculum sp.]|nr:MoaD/ThiS family protein [Desulfotomaculum sp.]